MTVQPSPYALLRGLQDQIAVLHASLAAIDRAANVLAGMLDTSAPDPLLNWSPPRPAVEPPPRKLIADEPWTPRPKAKSNRPMRRVEIGGVPVILSEARASMIDALREKPRTTEDIVTLGLSASMDAVRKSFVCINDELEKLGIPHRVQPIERLSRIGPRGGSVLPRYALVDPSKEIVAPDFPPAAQSEAAAGVSPEQGASASADGGDDTIVAAHGVQFVTPTGDGGTSRVEPSPAADAKPRHPNPGAYVGVDQVLDLWRDTTASKLDIARQIGISRATVVAILTDARARLEPRVIAGDTVRATAKEARALANSIPRSDDAPPSAVPASPPAASTRPPAGPSEGKPIPAPKPSGALPIEPGDLLAVDVKQRRVTTHKGSYEVAGANLARALDMLKGGHLFDLALIARKSGWPTPDAARSALGFERNRLAEHGVDLFLDAKVGARLRAAE